MDAVPSLADARSVRYQKLPYLRWVLPNAPHNLDAMAQAWYMPKALPSAMKPPVPGEVEDEGEPDDEAGIMKSVEYVDKLVEAELEKTGGRVVVGGFSQGCAISLVWGLTGRFRDRVTGVVGMSGYLPLAGRLAALQKDRPGEGGGGGEGTKKRWLLCHGTKDMMVPVKLFGTECEELSKWIDLEKEVDGHVYEGLNHSTNASELRDILGFLEKVVPA